MTDAQIVELGIRVRPSCCEEATAFHLLTVALLGWASWSVSRQEHQKQAGESMADTGRWTLVGDFSMHAMRLTPSEARYPHLQGQIFEHGQLV